MPVCGRRISVQRSGLRRRGKSCSELCEGLLDGQENIKRESILALYLRSWQAFSCQCRLFSRALVLKWR